MAKVPHFKHPLTVEGGVVATVEQDSLEDIAQCVEAVARTIVGSRIDAPGFGVPDETFLQQGASPSVAPYIRAVEAAEPRAHLLGEARLEDLVKKVILKVSTE